MFRNSGPDYDLMGPPPNVPGVRRPPQRRHQEPQPPLMADEETAGCPLPDQPAVSQS